MKNYYKTLGVHRGSTPQELKLAFHKIARETHPDKTPGRVDEFVAARAAYEELRYDITRAKYDKKLKLLGEPCERCSASGTKVKRKNWAEGQVVPCPVCEGCGYLNLKED